LGCEKIGKVFPVSELLWFRVAIVFVFFPSIFLVGLALLDRLVAIYLVVFDYQLYNID